MVFFNIKIRVILPSLHFLFQNFPVYFSKWNCQFFKNPIRIWGDGHGLYRFICREFSFYTILLPNPIHLRFCLWNPVVFVSVFFTWVLHIPLKFTPRFKKKSYCYYGWNLFFWFIFWLSIIYIKERLVLSYIQSLTWCY